MSYSFNQEFVEKALAGLKKFADTEAGQRMAKLVNEDPEAFTSAFIKLCQQKNGGKLYFDDRR